MTSTATHTAEPPGRARPVPVIDRYRDASTTGVVGCVAEKAATLGRPVHVIDRYRDASTTGVMGCDAEKGAKLGRPVHVIDRYRA